MKKLFLLLFIAGSLFAVNNIYSQTNNALLEFCTGTWCPWCPCGDQIAENIQMMRPNTLVLAYHGGGGGDPFLNYNGNNILGLLGLNSYPTGVVGRQSGIINRGAWAGWVNVTSNYTPGVNISVTKTYNTSTRQLQVTANVTALRTIDTASKINFVIYEDNVIYYQAGNGDCPGGSAFNHKWIVRNMINGALGEDLATSHWSQGSSVSKSSTTTLDAGWNANNCSIAVFVYLAGTPYTTAGNVQQTFHNNVVAPVGVLDPVNVVSEYSLSQNYPNPFNPSTRIQFALPKDDNVSLKIFDMTGREVATYMNNSSLKAGEYNVEIDASSWSSGIYFYTLTTDEFTATKKMILVK